MEILLVEDDEDKREQLILFVNENKLGRLTEVRSFQSGLAKIKTHIYDLILLDMSMPTFDISANESGGRSQPFGGELLLFEMQRRGIVSKVIVVSQFELFGDGEDKISIEDLNNRLLDSFSENYIGIVQYSISYTSWKNKILDKLKLNL